MNYEEDYEDFTQDCDHCGRDVLDVHPEGWMIVDIHGPILREETFRHLLCAQCVLQLGEFLVPELKEHIPWQQQTDQLNALIAEHRSNKK